VRKTHTVWTADQNWKCTVSEISIALDADAHLEVIPRLRAFSSGVPALLDCPVSIDDLMLLVTEIGANAVQSGSSRLHLSFERCAPARIRVAVTDDGAGVPMLRRPGPLDRDGGRGLMIVDAIASSWGSEGSSADDLTTVWFVLNATS
jgi:hypothetical protein